LGKQARPASQHRVWTCRTLALERAGEILLERRRRSLQVAGLKELIELVFFVPGRDRRAIAAEEERAEVERLTRRPGVDLILEDVTGGAGLGLLHSVGRKVRDAVELIFFADHKVWCEQFKDEGGVLGAGRLLGLDLVRTTDDLEDESTLRGLHLVGCAGGQR